MPTPINSFIPTPSLFWQLSLNGTRVTSNFHGAMKSVTIRDDEIEKLEPYVELEESTGAIVTIERGVRIN